MKARIGVIGGGVYGTTVLQALSTAHRMGQIELAALAEIKESVLKEQSEKFKVKGYLNYQDMLHKEKLDAVVVVTPDYLHREITREVADHGIHLLVQKPLDVTSEGALEMVRAAKENNVMLYVDFHKRHDPGHIQLKQAIKSGRLGKIQYGYVWMEDKILVPTVWFKNWAQYSSPAWFLGIHFFDLICWLLESKPKKIYATGVKDKLVGLNIDTYDSLQAKIEFENGAHFSVDTSWILPNNFPSLVNQGIRVVGSNGVWEVDSQDRGVFYAEEQDPGAVVPNYYSMIERDNPLYGPVVQGYIIESILYFTQLVNKLKAGAKLQDLAGCYPSGDEAVVSTQICEALHRSVETGKIIEF
jgi:predicted dehydrogenase